MIRSLRHASSLLAALLALTASAMQAAQAMPNPQDTRFVAEPTVSARHIAFTYAGDVWIADRSGGNVRRLTSDIGEESAPVFSPDGNWVAFNAQYEGNTDVYIVSAAGGVPRRLTFHPAVDAVQGFTPDGKRLVFASPRNMFNNRHRHLFTVPLEGGVETQHEIPHAWRAVYSPDGKRVAYNPGAPSFEQWKQYRGGRTSEIWLFTDADNSVEKIPQPKDRCNDVDPQWVGNTVYFRSDRDGEFNLYAYDTVRKSVSKLTSHGDFPVLALSATADGLVYEQAGWLHSLPLTGGTSTRIKVGVVADLAASRPRFVKGAKYIRNASLSPTAARVALEFRGEIVTLPAEKGDPRNLTETVAAHERSPAWSPDGKSVAYFTDASGEYELHIKSQDGKGAVRKFKLNGAGYYDRPEWSPDSKKFLFTDNSYSLFMLDIASGAVKKIASEPLYSPIKTIKGSWSPDSRWVVYTLNTLTYTKVLTVYSVEQDKSFAITDGLADIVDPVFDKGGKQIYFFASTDAGPTNNWFSLENADNRPTRSLWAAVLTKDAPSPLAPESDEEKPAPEKREAAKEDAKADAKDAAKDAAKPADAAKAGEGDKKPAAPAAPAAPTVANIRIDFDGIAQRIINLPVPAAPLSSLQVGAPGQVFFLREADGKRALQRFDFKDRKTETLLPEVDAFQVSFDGKKVLWRSKDTWAIGPAGGKTIPPTEGRLKIDAVEVKVDPRAEWTQIFHEAWRINRDYFYDPAMHGANWPALRQKYAALLPELGTRNDLFRVVRWMLSELVVGHSYQQPGENFNEVKTVPGGLLGADYEVANGRYRFKKVYGGLNWNPDLRAPLAEPGIEVKAGEYLIAVQGKEVKPPMNLYAAFENTSGKTIEITVSTNADGSKPRTLKVVPIANEFQLRNRDWVEANIRKVDAATGGRVAYVYVPNTAGLGHQYFKRYFYPQAHKDAVIVDERFNGGGSVADYVITHLQRQEIAWWAMRYGADMKTPSASIQGPKAMLIDETAGSGGDLLPWMFRKNNLGPLIGKRTWGGLVGILGYPVLMDGGTITAPNLAFWTRDEGFRVENEGVAPDIEIEQTPADVIAGRDPQLEKAIEVILAELKKNPPQKPVRPPFPVKVQKQ
ncbi:MAG: PDZ domain-containing protein [Burkholderiales bacterium]|nr:PDZ domain-containing protein [Burkholderiales bacterium]